MEELYRKLSFYLHPGSLLIAVAFDLLWTLPEGALTASWVGLILLPVISAIVFATCGLAVLLIQRFAAADDWSQALIKALILGILAAIPFSFIGMAVGIFWGLMRLTYGVDEEVILLGKLARSWRGIELTLRRLAPPEVRAQSLDVVIDCLHDQHFLSTSITEHLHALRRQRNVTMHEMSTDALGSLVDQVTGMENLLRRRFLRAA